VDRSAAARPRHRHWRPGTALATAILLLNLALPGPGEGRGTGVSPEVERILAETAFDRPPSRAATNEFLARLQRAGVETPTDLHPYLTRSETVRANAIIAIARLGARNAPTLLALAAFVHEAAPSGAPSAAAAMKLILDTAPREEALHFGLAEASRLHFDALDAVVSWIVEQDAGFLHASPEGDALIRACLRRMEVLFGSGSYSGRWPLRFSLLVGRPPFTEPAYAAAVSTTFVAAVANTTRTTDLRELAFIGAFAGAARTTSADSERAQPLLPLASHAPLPLAKLIVWRLVAEGLDDSTAGREIVSSTTTTFAELAAFTNLLRTPPAGGPSHASALADEIARALIDLDRSGGRAAAS